VRETIELACSIPMDSVQFSIATPFPGTRFYDQCVQNGWLATEKWDDYDGNFGSVVSYPQLSKAEIEELLYFAYREYETRRKRDSLTVRFRKEVRRRGLPGALRRAAESVALRISRKTEESLHAVEERHSIALGRDWYPYDANEGGRPAGTHSSMRVLTQSPSRSLHIVARTPREMERSHLKIFQDGALLSTLDICQTWQEFIVKIPGAIPTEITLQAYPTIPRRKDAYIQHHGAIVKKIGVTTE
jgi:hypothetical protein